MTDDLPPLFPLPSDSKRVVYLKEYEGEQIEWEDRKTCWMSLNKQGGPIWDLLRRCAITMSMISKYARRVPRRLQEPFEDLAAYAVGTKKKLFPLDQLLRMKAGSDGEPFLRKWDSEQLGVTIRETGIAVWKQDPRFRGSIDGETDGFFCEYKMPQKMYRRLIEYIEAIKKGYTPPPSEHEHIFNSHYDQITGNGVIVDKEVCNYVVASFEDRLVYRQSVLIDHDHWNKCLYPAGVQMYETYIQPLMDAYQVSRIDPWMMLPIYSVK